MYRNVGNDVANLLCLAHLGHHTEATEMLEGLVTARHSIGSAEDETIGFWDTTSLEAAVLARHRQATELLLRRMSGCTSCTSGLWFTTCKGRHLGAAAALLDKPDEARKYYQKAIKDCTDMRFRPELALTRLQLAELLLDHYPDEKKEALEHLDFAIKEFQDMKMQPSLERALKHKEILGA
jgi:tetratricopeptide (TPR) repeat protein